MQFIKIFSLHSLLFSKLFIFQNGDNSVFNAASQFAHGTSEYIGGKEAKFRGTTTSVGKTHSVSEGNCKINETQETVNIGYSYTN